MPSVILGYNLASGGMPIISGCPWSGNASKPIGSIVLRLDKTASGNAYIGLSGGPVASGGLTIKSGGMFLSGSLGYSDGVVMYPGDAYQIPKLGTGPTSGTLNVYAAVDPAGSGQARLFYEIF